MRKQKNPYSTPPAVQDKIEQALELYRVWGDRLRRDPIISSLLHKLQRCLETTRKSMITLRVVSACKSCEEEEGGSCCGSGIEDKYDTFLLLINLLLGDSLQNAQLHKNSCYFLGKEGCTLTARHVLCVNYICSKLQKTLTREELIELQTCAGEELETLFLLTEALKTRVRGSPQV
jgi:hypothetical protein